MIALIVKNVMHANPASTAQIAKIVEIVQFVKVAISANFVLSVKTATVATVSMR